MTLDMESLALLKDALANLDEGFNALPEFSPEVNMDGLREALGEISERMQDNYPYQHPFYIGQMLKPPHPVARLAYMLSIYLNPNNHALDGGRASSRMEKEAIAELAGMVGWDRHLGHICSGGTMANMEALWIAGRIDPGRKIVASNQSHYTHERLCGVLGIPFEFIPCDSRARMDCSALEATLKKGGVGTVVVTVGTTATGAIDPLHDILALQEQYGFRIHVDSAYGGYFTLADNLGTHARTVFNHLSEADSIVIDPHKHGLQPYGCGCVLFRDPSVGRYYKHDSPYTYFTSDELHLGEISLECSRPGSSAVALWATMRMFPLAAGGEFARNLSLCRSAALKLYDLVEKDPRFVTLIEPELDIVIWAPKADSASAASRLSRAVFEEAAKENVHMAVANLPASLFKEALGDMNWDQEFLTVLRACAMKPEHFEWMDRIWEAFDRAATKVLV